MLVKKYYKVTDGRYVIKEYDNSFFADPKPGIEVTKEEYEREMGVVTEEEMDETLTEEESGGNNEP